MNILIIDDEKTILKTVYSQLMEMELGMERIDTADSAGEAKECMKNTIMIFSFVILSCLKWTALLLQNGCLRSIRM